MRLWHQSLLKFLPRTRLLGQHRECCALRGLGWGRRHAVVDYVFRHPYFWLCDYHLEVMSEPDRRGYMVDDKWTNDAYRGKTLGISANPCFYRDGESWLDESYEARGCVIYPEHDDIYLLSCLNNLAGKGADLENGKTVSGMILELAAKGIVDMNA